MKRPLYNQRKKTIIFRKLKTMTEFILIAIMLPMTFYLFIVLLFVLTNAKI